MPPEQGEKVVTRRADTGKEGPKLESIWKLYTDGASSSDGSGVGLMLIIPEGREYTYALCFEFKTTNNEAEYEALLAELRIAREMEIKSLAIFTDSQLMANQIKGIFKARQPMIKQYLEKVKEVLKGFDTFTIEHVRRNQNKKADALRKLDSMTFEHLTKQVLLEVLAKRSINDKKVSKVEAERGEN
ncbi:reverse transcriptase domain-containing protein [Tanacetum coccineum]